VCRPRARDCNAAGSGSTAAPRRAPARCREWTATVPDAAATSATNARARACTDDAGLRTRRASVPVRRSVRHT
jgi:hypothetical protein